MPIYILVTKKFKSIPFLNDNAGLELSLILQHCLCVAQRVALVTGIRLL